MPWGKEQPDSRVLPFLLLLGVGKLSLGKWCRGELASGRCEEGEYGGAELSMAA